LGLLVFSGKDPAQADVPALGVLAKEIVVGTHVDLSGPLKPWGTAVRNGLTMAIEEANKAGGINQRSRKAYRPRRCL